MNSRTFNADSVRSFCLEQPDREENSWQKFILLDGLDPPQIVFSITWGIDR